MNESTLVPREEISDLDWLARNVHVWPTGAHQPWCYVYWKGGKRKVSGNCITVVSPCVKIDKAQWLARRAELQNKPSFADHPDAKCFVQNDYGTWFKNRNSTNVRPESDGGWFDRDMSCGWTQLGAGEVLGDWRDTLEKRPEQKAFEPLTNIEDNQEKDMKQDNGWYERGDLPPVGIAVQLWHGGTYAYDCELIAKRGNDFVLWNLTWDRPDSADCMMCVFKPTPTEREILADLIESHRQMSALVVADAILAAGFSLGEVKNKINLFVD